MPATTANPAAWFSTAQRAMQQLRDRRRRAWTGEGATAATRSSTPTPPGGGGGGGGPGGGGGGGGPTSSTGTSTVPISFTIAEHLTAGSAGAAAGSAASVAAVTAATATPHGMAPLSGLGAIVAQVRRNRRGFIDARRAFVLVALAIVAAAVVFGQPATTPAAYADGSAARVTVAPDGFALAGWPDSLAIATGPTCGSIATQGKAFAAAAGSTATAYAPAHAAGVPGSVLVLIGTRPDGSRVGVIVRPTTTPGVARAWTWYTLTNGALASAGEVLPTDRQLITNAQQGTLP